MNLCRAVHFESLGIRDFYKSLPSGLDGPPPPAEDEVLPPTRKDNGKRRRRNILSSSLDDDTKRSELDADFSVDSGLAGHSGAATRI